MQREGTIYVSTCLSCSAQEISLNGFISDRCCDDPDYDYESFDYTNQRTNKVFTAHSCSICSNKITSITEMSEDDDDHKPFDDYDDDDDNDDDNDDDDDDDNAPMCYTCNKKMELRFKAHLIS